MLETNRELLHQSSQLEEWLKAALAFHEEVKKGMEQLSATIAQVTKRTVEQVQSLQQKKSSQQAATIEQFRDEFARALGDFKRGNPNTMIELYGRMDLGTDYSRRAESLAVLEEAGGRVPHENPITVSKQFAAEQSYGWLGVENVDKIKDLLTQFGVLTEGTKGN